MKWSLDQVFPFGSTIIGNPYQSNSFSKTFASNGNVNLLTLSKLFWTSSYVQSLSSCKKDGFVDYRLVEFSIQVRSNLYKFTRNLEFKPQFWGTALYSTIYNTLTGILSNTPTEDKVLIQIFTDGQDTDSSEYRIRAKEVIEQCNSKGWTVTFVGTESDVAFVQRNLSIADSNTLVHDNTAKGIKMSFESYMDNQTTYSKNVSRGEDVTTGFFKDIKNATNG